MPEEFEGDLAGSVFWGADLSRARFRDVNLTARNHSRLAVNVDIDALVDRVVINGVDVTAYVNERDPWYPLRAMLRASNPRNARGVGRARGRVAATSPADSFPTPSSTSRLTASGRSSRRCDISCSPWTSGSPRRSSERVSDPIGLPNTGSVDFPWPGLDDDLAPSYRGARRARRPAARFRD